MFNQSVSCVRVCAWLGCSLACVLSACSGSGGGDDGASGGTAAPSAGTAATSGASMNGGGVINGGAGGGAGTNNLAGSDAGGTQSAGSAGTAGATMGGASVGGDSGGGGASGGSGGPANGGTSADGAGGGSTSACGVSPVDLPSRASASTVTVAATSTPPAALDERSIMGKLRELGDSSPAYSLELARAGNRRFPGSADAPEREWYVCKSLVNLENFYDAREEARVMVATYPGTAWTTDVERHLLVNPLDLPGDPPP